jgi:uncharacterized radical SAM superfamily protein
MDQLWDTKEPGSQGVDSYLVSGGCNTEGAVPLKDHVELLKSLSSEHTLIAHTGLLKGEDIEMISPYISAASFNFIGDDETIKDVMGLDKTKEDFIDSFNSLREKVRTVPHVTIGLNKGELAGEYDSVDLLSLNPPDAVVFNVLIPTKETDYENVEPPKISDVIDVISYAKERLSESELYIGCMRPGGSYRNELDDKCVDLGVDRIVMPAKTAKDKAREMDLAIEEKWECCIL